jgi:hypothetical protein
MAEMARHAISRPQADVVAAAERLTAPAVEVRKLTKTYPGGV